MPTRFDALLGNPALFHAALEFNDGAPRGDSDAARDLPREEGEKALPPREASKIPSSEAWAERAAHSDLAGLFASFAKDGHAQRRLWRCIRTVAPRWTAPPAAASRTMIWCFAPRPNRLAFLPPPLLARLQLYWNAAVWAEDLARIIERERLARIMARIGPEVYRYAVRRGRFQLGGLRALFRQDGKAEERTGEQAGDDARAGGKTGIGQEAGEAQWLAEGFRRPGERMLALCVAQWPEELRVAWENRWRRIRPEAPPPVDIARFPALWPWVERILLQEVAPEWQPCFNS
ncbi:MAG: hypothetical protein LBD06_10475 [Candidatus Accumulibacter sp.]|jgi:hypothetical protein|nr:hypothetical protein [Accumulibacter sp.]